MDIGLEQNARLLPPQGKPTIPCASSEFPKQFPQCHHSYQERGSITAQEGGLAKLVNAIFQGGYALALTPKAIVFGGHQPATHRPQLFQQPH